MCQLTQPVGKSHILASFHVNVSVLAIRDYSCLLQRTPCHSDYAPVMCSGDSRFDSPANSKSLEFRLALTRSQQELEAEEESLAWLQEREELPPTQAAASSSVVVAVSSPGACAAVASSTGGAAAASSGTCTAAAHPAGATAVGTAEVAMVKMEEDDELADNSVNVGVVATRAKRYTDGRTSAADFKDMFEKSLAEATQSVSARRASITLRL